MIVVPYFLKLKREQVPVIVRRSNRVFIVGSLFAVIIEGLHCWDVWAWS